MKHILIVDDAYDLARMLQEALRAAHPEISATVVPSGEEAFLESMRMAVDLLVTDIRLPGINGLDLIQKIRARQPHVKVILISGLSMDEKLEKQKDKAKPDIFLSKPLTLAEFMDAVNVLLGEDQTADILPAAAAAAEEDDAVLESPQGDPNQALIRELRAVLPGEPAAPVSDRQAQTQPLNRKAPPEDESLSAVLTRLRSSLGALAAFLLDERGRPVAQAGDLPDAELEERLILPVLSSLSAGEKVSYLLGQPDGAQHPAVWPSVQAYRGSRFDLVIAPVGQYSLLLALEQGRSALRLALAFEEALTAQQEICAALDRMGLHIQPAAGAVAPETLPAEPPADVEPAGEMPLSEIPEAPLVGDHQIEEFQELFSMTENGQLDIEDADSFWDSTLESTEDAGATPPGMITFEQAQKLGLFPPQLDDE